MTTTQAVVSSAVRPSLRGRRFDVAGAVFAGALLLSLLFTLALLGVLIGDQILRGGAVLAERGTGLLTSNLSSQPSQAGLFQGLIGTALLAAMVSLIAFPVGILTAVYLEEYAPANAITRFIDINIRNLDGVPSVVYGLLGLAIFVALFATVGIGTGKNILTGGLTLAVLAL